MSHLIVVAVKWSDNPEFQYRETRKVINGNVEYYITHCEDILLGYVINTDAGPKTIVAVHQTVFTLNPDGTLTQIDALLKKLPPPRTVKVINNRNKPTTTWNDHNDF